MVGIDGEENAEDGNKDGDEVATVDNIMVGIKMETLIEVRVTSDSNDVSGCQRW